MPTYLHHPGMNFRFTRLGGGSNWAVPGQCDPSKCRTLTPPPVFSSSSLTSQASRLPQLGASGDPRQCWSSSQRFRHHQMLFSAQRPFKKRPSFGDKPGQCCHPGLLGCPNWPREPVGNYSESRALPTCAEASSLSCLGRKRAGTLPVMSLEAPLNEARANTRSLRRRFVFVL